MIPLQPTLPLSIYVHLPWCVRKCPYCDFNSHENESADFERYVDALLADLQQELPAVWGRRIDTIFFGGGTPSLFPAKSLDRFLSGLRSLLPIRPDTEITLEANPGTFEQERFNAFRELGINRLSIGVQSFNPEQLKRLGRIHDDEEAHQAIHVAQQAGFERINLDLMFGLPEQSIDEAMTDLETALHFNTEHVSYYQLTLEPNTLFHKHPPRLPDDDLLADMHQAAQVLFAQAGLKQYEVSAWSRPSTECKHNLNYWQFGDYLGLGAGAHGKISEFHQHSIRRYWKTRDPEQYMEAALTGNAVSDQRLVEGAERVFEFMLNSLRLNRGFTQELFEQRCGIAYTDIEPRLIALSDQGLLEFSDTHWRCTARGRNFLNDVTGAFLPHA